MKLDVYVQKYKNGDSKAFDIIYAETYSLVRAAIYSYIQDKYIVEDLIQDVYMKFSKNIEKYQSNNFKAWIYTMAKNTALDYLKKKKEVISDNVYLKEDNNVTHPYIKYAIDHLNEEQREIFLMKVLCGNTTKKISLLLGLDISRVNKLYNEAKANLKKSLEDISDEIK